MKRNRFIYCSIFLWKCLTAQTSKQILEQCPTKRRNLLAIMRNFITFHYNEILFLYLFISLFWQLNASACKQLFKRDLAQLNLSYFSKYWNLERRVHGQLKFIFQYHCECYHPLSNLSSFDASGIEPKQLCPWLQR